MNDNILEMRSITKTFPGVKALQDVLRTTGASGRPVRHRVPLAPDAGPIGLSWTDLGGSSRCHAWPLATCAAVQYLEAISNFWMLSLYTTSKSSRYEGTILTPLSYDLVSFASGVLPFRKAWATMMA